MSGFGNKEKAVAEGLIIVESPAKARTLKRFLGNRFDVLASMGHVRDLPERELAVDVEQDFQPRYEVVDSRKQTISDLKKAVQKRPEVILASDPDREGEAIAWHLSEVLRLRSPKRIEFHEITDAAVRRALEHPREIDMRLVNAQQARRVVDRLVGYRLSPFLWSKVQKGIGAGRVQSVALRLAGDRAEAIRRLVAGEAEARAKAWIKGNLGEKYLGKPRQEKSRPGAQEAHEAIRPTDPTRRPEDIQRFLSPDQYRVYDLIWRRFLASRMAAAQYALTTVEIEAGAFGLRANGSVLTFDGFYRVWQRSDED